jgi:hypothetical protein
LALHKVLRPFLNLVLKDLIIFFWVLWHMSFNWCGNGV